MMIGGLSLVILPLVDIVRDWLMGRVGSSASVRVLCVYHNDDQQDIVSRALGSKTYSLTRLPVSQWGGREDYDMYDMIVLVGDYADEVLQDAFDQIRLGHQEFYHIPASGFLDDVVYEPTVLGSLHTFRLSPTKLDDWAVVFKRGFDVV